MNKVDQCTGITKYVLGNSPVLLHCSAGVGRTCGFIAVDSILDAIRREIQAERKPDEMDVDSSNQLPIISSSPTFRLKPPILLNNDIDIPHALPMFTTTSDTVLWAQNVRAGQVWWLIVNKIFNIIITHFSLRNRYHLSWYQQRANHK